MNTIKIATLVLGAGIVSFSSCKKEEPELRDEKLGGCLDQNSPLYNAEADFDDESCRFAYVNAYEITFHPSKDENGDDWDLWVNTDADLIFRIKPEGAANWMFESAEMTDQAHDQPATWTAPENIKLLNQNYTWELYDVDTGSGDDFVASGTFNPIALADNGEIITTGTNASGNPSQLVLTYDLDE